MKQVENKSNLAKTLSVSRSSLYYKPKQETKDLNLASQIKAVLAEHPSYGHKRIAIVLKINKKRVNRVMKKFNLKPYRRRASKPLKKDDLNKAASKYPNLCKNLCPIKPNILWATDFTYLKFDNSFIYLATVIDVFSRKIVGFKVSRRHNVDLVKLALIDALTKENTSPEILHSDQGSEYTSQEYISFAENLQIKISLSNKSSPWENGYQESFYSGLKLELGDINRFQSYGELLVNIYSTIHYYNNLRIHTKLKMPPLAFINSFNQKITALKGVKLLSNKMGT